MQLAATSIDTPLGRYALVVSRSGVRRFQPAGGAPPAAGGATSDAGACRVLEEARAAFLAWFAGDCAALDDLPLAPEGTPFRRRVWRALCEIETGTTASYGEIARRLGRPGAARAVGGANHHNPIAVAIPCHRVVGADGSLVGYAGGLARKRWLLAHEARWRAGQAASSKSKVPSPPISPRALARSRERAAASI